ncbi:MAG TPA: hypothetical protein VIL86_03425 [Tepidisphaeraceae bacterium]|jgi:hypothetical protein
MDIVKKNLFSILLGVVALVAIVASFWPLGNWKNELQEKVSKSAGEFQALQGQESKSRHLPTLDPNTSEAPELGNNIFPNDEIIKAGSKAITAVKDDADRMLKTAVKLNTHALLVDGSLPVPGNRAFDFREAYLARMAAVNKSGEVARGSLIADVGAGMPPTKEEFDEALKALRKEYDLKYVDLPTKAQANKEEVDAEYDAAAKLLPEQIRQERAQSVQLYIDRDAFDASKDIGERSTPSADQIWFAQLLLWLQEDAANGIHAANDAAFKLAENSPEAGDEKNPFNPDVRWSAIKRLVKMDVLGARGGAPSPAMYVTSAGPAEGPGPRKPAAEAGGEAASFVPSISPTGRVSNPLYDVFHYTLVMDVDITQLPLVIQELERNHLITVMKVDLACIDSAAEQANGYAYGKHPIARVSLQCEAIFLRQWTVPLMPPSIKTMLGIEEKTAPTVRAE